MDKIHKGIPIVIAGPSGVGKSTICHKLLLENPDLVYSVSATTRVPRNGEEDGSDYHFVDRPTFEKWIDEGHLIEHAEVYGQLYGTPRSSIETPTNDGRDVLLDLDVQGSEKLKGLFPESVLIFVLPPSIRELEQRLRLRRTNPPTEIETRMAKLHSELKMMCLYDYVIVNESLEKSVEIIRSIIVAERFRRTRYLQSLHASDCKLLDELDDDLKKALLKCPD